MSVLLYVTSAVDDRFGPLLQAAEVIADGAFTVLVTRAAPPDTKPHELRDWLTLPAVDGEGVGASLLRLYAEQMRPALAIFAGPDAAEMLAACRPWAGATVLVRSEGGASASEGFPPVGARPDWVVDAVQGLLAHTDVLRARVPRQWVLERGAPLKDLETGQSAAAAPRDVEVFWRGPVSSELETGIEAALRAGGRVRVQLGMRDGILGAPRRSLRLLRSLIARSPERLEVHVVAEDGIAIPAARLLTRGLAEVRGLLGRGRSE